jgi:hypothetical protein
MTIERDEHTVAWLQLAAHSGFLLGLLDLMAEAAFQRGPRPAACSTAASPVTSYTPVEPNRQPPASISSRDIGLPVTDAAALTSMGEASVSRNTASGTLARLASPGHDERRPGPGRGQRGQAGSTQDRPARPTRTPARRLVPHALYRAGVVAWYWRGRDV